MKTADRIVTFLKESIAQNGYSPTVREIAAAVGLKSPSPVHGHLDRLEKKGIIQRKEGASRNIELIGETKRTVPAEAIEQIVKDLDNLRCTAIDNNGFDAANAYEYAADRLRQVIG